MTKDEVTHSLASIASDQQLADQGDDLVQSWLDADVGFAAVDPVLRFMEAHADWDFGTPGPLVHFVERFHGQGYAREVIASVERQPTTHTLWMLNRLIDGERAGSAKTRLLGVLGAAAIASNAEPDAAEDARRFHAPCFSRLTDRLQSASSVTSSCTAGFPVSAHGAFQAERIGETPTAALARLRFGNWAGT